MPGKGLVDGSLVFGTPLVAFGLQHALVRDTEYGLALSAVAVGLLYVTLGTLLWRRGSALFSLLVEVLVSLAVVFGTLAIPLALDARWTGAAWALEGAGLVWVGMRQRQLLTWLAGLAMQAAAAEAFFVALFLSATPETPIANGIFLGALLLSLAGFSSAWQLRRELTIFAVGALGWGLVWWFGAPRHVARTATVRRTQLERGCGSGDSAHHRDSRAFFLGDARRGHLGICGGARARAGAFSRATVRSDPESHTASVGCIGGQTIRPAHACVLAGQRRV